MRKFFIGIAVGIALALAGTAMGQNGVFWQRGGRGYLCNGIDGNVFCKETKKHPAYQISLIPGYVEVAYNDKLVYFCKRKTVPQASCAIVP